ncbi:unnamed protein product [Amoebophrya sp. A25]|nr:unnamed protein product [Amoebophrya sp. A25]|eukprot:GSA25T00021107001.1
MSSSSCGVLLRLKLEGLEVASDLSVLNLDWQIRKFLLGLDRQPSTGAYLSVIPGTLAEVCDHLWSVQELFLKQTNVESSTTTLLTLSMRELLDPTLNLDGGFYENAVCLDDNSALVVHLQLQQLSQCRVTPNRLLDLPMLQRNDEQITPPTSFYVLKLRMVNSARNVRHLVCPVPGPDAQQGEHQLLALRVRGIVQNAREALFALVLAGSWEEVLETLREVQEQCVVLVNRDATQDDGRLPPVREEDEDEAAEAQSGERRNLHEKVNRSSSSQGYFVSPDDISPTVASQSAFEFGERTCSYPLDVRPLISHVQDAMQVDDGVSDLLDKTVQLPVTLTVPALARPASVSSGFDGEAEEDEDDMHVLTFEAHVERRSFPGRGVASPGSSTQSPRWSPKRIHSSVGSNFHSARDTEGTSSAAGSPQEQQNFAMQQSQQALPPNLQVGGSSSSTARNPGIQHAAGDAGGAGLLTQRRNNPPQPMQLSQDFENGTLQQGGASANVNKKDGTGSPPQPNSFILGSAAGDVYGPPGANNVVSSARGGGFHSSSGSGSANDNSIASSMMEESNSMAMADPPLPNAPPGVGHVSWVDADQKYVPSFLPNQDASIDASTPGDPNGPDTKPLPQRILKTVDDAFEEIEKLPHQWRLSVELRSAKLTHFQAKIFVKYFYPFVQQVKPFRTNPPTVCRKNSMTYLPHGFAAYHFTDISPAKLKEKFAEGMNKVLRCEVWQRDPHASDQIIGCANIDVEQIMDVPEVSKAPSEGFNQSGNLLPKVRTLDQTLPILSANGETHGTLRVVIFLEDLGEMPEQSIAAKLGGQLGGSIDAAMPMEFADRGGAGGAASNMGVSVSSSVGATSQMPSANALIGTGGRSTDEVARMRSLPAYSAAYELELWKRAEEASFKVKLQEDERIRKMKLQEEYEEREKKRSKEFNEKRQEVMQLEQKLKQKLLQMQQREGELEARDSAFLRRAEDTDRKAAILETETEAKVRLLKQEMADEIALEREKARRWEQKYVSLEQECRQWQERYTSIEADFVKFRKQQFEETNANPMEQVRADLKIKTYECKEAQKLIQQLRSSRDHFKESVTKLCAQVSTLEEEKRTLEREVMHQQGDLRAARAQATLRGDMNMNSMAPGEQDALDAGGRGGSGGTTTPGRSRMFNRTGNLGDPSSATGGLGALMGGGLGQGGFGFGGGGANNGAVFLGNHTTSTRDQNVEEGISLALRKIQEELRSLHQNYAEEAPQRPPVPLGIAPGSTMGMQQMNFSTPNVGIQRGVQTPSNGQQQQPGCATTPPVATIRGGMVIPGVTGVMTGGLASGQFGGQFGGDASSSGTATRVGPSSVPFGGATTSGGLPPPSSMPVQPAQSQPQPQTRTAPATAPVHPTGGPATTASTGDDVIAQERRRLEALRAELLESGLYSENDAIFQHMGF